MRTFGFAMLVFWVGCGGGGGGGAAGDTGSFDPGSPTVGGGLPADQPSSRYARSGWIEAGNPAGEQSFIAHASWFDAIHPAWWKLTADGSQIIAIPNGDVDQQGVLEAARAAHVLVEPLVFFDDVAGLRAMMSDPARLAAHARELADIATQHGYDGLELAY